MLRCLTAGESHGKALIAILDGMPSHLPLSAEDINKELARRQVGYGRGGRMKIEKDRVEILTGVRSGLTLGSPITLLVRNLDWDNWQKIMAVEKDVSSLPCERAVTKPRPGHADLAGALKYNEKDIRNILERASARETASRVAVGAVCKGLLKEFGMCVYSWVMEIGGVRAEIDEKMKDMTYREIFALAEASDLRCPDKGAERRMKERIDEVRENGDSLGGIFETLVTGVPPGLGSHTQWDRKLNARLAKGIMSIQAIKGVEIGLGFEASKRPGSTVHDEIFYKSQESRVESREQKAESREFGTESRELSVESRETRAESGEEKIPNPELPHYFWPLPSGFYRKTNNAGGIEGGMSNGEPIILRAVMKPIPTLMKPLRSVDIVEKEPFDASKERSDICAVPSASVVAEAVVAFEIAGAFLEKFGGDSIEEIKRNYSGYLEQLSRF